MSEDQLDDLRRHVDEWQEDEQATDAEMAAALRRLLAEYAAAAR